MSGTLSSACDAQNSHGHGRHAAHDSVSPTAAIHSWPLYGLCTRMRCNNLPWAATQAWWPTKHSRHTHMVIHGGSTTFRVWPRAV